MKSEDIARLPVNERSVLFEHVQSVQRDNAKLPAAMIEKDFWVSFILERIFADAELLKILRFKGGTSLSKAHHLIERFSEDVDLILDWTRFLDLGDPNAARSKTQQGKFNELLNTKAGEFVQGELRARIQEAIGNVCSIQPSELEPLNLNVVYPKCYADDYLSPTVKLEIGPLASWVPCETKRITSFVADAEPQLGIAPFEVTVIKAVRTFWEKIEALHHEHYRPETKKAPRRFSRHYYDVYRMFNTSVYAEAKSNTALLADVVAFTEKFYPRSWAHFELCHPGTMLLMPSSHALPVMRADYAAMREMIYGAYPSFDEILDTISIIEKDINSMNHGSGTTST